MTVPPTKMADLVVAAAEVAGVVDRLTVQSFDWRGLRHLRRQRPDILLGWLTQGQTDAGQRLWWDGVDAAGLGGSVPQAVAGEGGPLWVPHRDELTAEIVAKSHDLGLQVIPWDVDATEDITRLMAWRVDGIITDRPDLALRLCAAGL